MVSLTSPNNQIRDIGQHRRCHCVIHHHTYPFMYTHCLRPLFHGHGGFAKLRVSKCDTEAVRDLSGRQDLTLEQQCGPYGRESPSPYQYMAERENYSEPTMMASHVH